VSANEISQGGIQLAVVDILATKPEFRDRRGCLDPDMRIYYPTRSSASGLSYHAAFGQCYYLVSHGHILEDAVGELQCQLNSPSQVAVLHSLCQCISDVVF
jgi:hypothetical protein